MIEPTVAAYAAGLIDGDGTIQVNKKKRKIGFAYAVTLSVSQVDERGPSWLLRHLGGRVNKFFSSKERRQPVYRWSIDTHSAASLLQVILPFLVEKQERAKLAIEMQALMKPRYGHNGITGVRIAPSAEVSQKRDEIFSQMKSLNKKFGRNHWNATSIGVN